MVDAAAALSARSKEQAFLEAARSGDLDSLKQLGAALHEEGKAAAAVAVAVRDANKRTALHFAAREGRTEVCAFLIDQLGLPVDPRTTIVKLHSSMLHGKAVCKPWSSMGATALHHAAGIGNIELMKLLLDNGVDVESESDAGTPLVWAAGHRQQDAVKLLLEHKC